MDTVILRTNSHRARQRLQGRLTTPAVALYSFELGSGFYEVTAEDADRVLSKDYRGNRIPGITRSRVKRSDLMRCWNGD